MNVSQSFKSIYRSYHYFFNCRQLFRSSGPHQYSTRKTKNYLKNYRITAAYETSCRLDTSIFKTIIPISNNENCDIQL